MNTRTKAACHRSIDVDGMTTADLHYRLGKMLEDRPGVLQTQYGPKHDTDRRVFEGLSLDSPVNMDCANRLQEFSAQRRAEMGEDRWQRLNEEWNAA